MSAIETMARAIWEQRRKYAAAHWPDTPPLEEWGDGTVPKANGLMEEAHEALKAIREPSAAVVAAHHVVPDDTNFLDRARDNWRAMLDAALAEASA